MMMKDNSNTFDFIEKDNKGDRVDPPTPPQRGKKGLKAQSYRLHCVSMVWGGGGGGLCTGSDDL